MLQLDVLNAEQRRNLAWTTLEEEDETEEESAKCTKLLVLNVVERIKFLSHREATSLSFVRIVLENIETKFRSDS